MWIERNDKKKSFINSLEKMSRQVLVLRGARQVGKTSFVLNALAGLSDHPQLKLNLFYPSSFRLQGIDFLGRDFFGRSPAGDEFLKNIERALSPHAAHEKPAIVFIDEVDRYPIVMESIQALAEASPRLKFILTGSNLENIPVDNAATGRKKYFDLYPITFREFLSAGQDGAVLDYYHSLSLKGNARSSYYHQRLNDAFETYLRLGGLPKILDAFLDPQSTPQPIPELIMDLAVSIEENVKTVLGQKARLYEYEDVLRKIALLSVNTLKFSRLQVNHASRIEAKRLVMKTVGARVAHKIRLYESESDLSKYILFDCGLVNYLLNGSDLLRSVITPNHRAVQLETFVGQDLIAGLVSRDDLSYWKSGNRAEVEFLLRSPFFIGMDVKTRGSDPKSLNSLALMEPGVQCLIQISDRELHVNRDHKASLPNHEGERRVPLLTIPHYLVGRVTGLISEL